ncbi:MAG: crosslink repair DNA glycosylase YcaQ family protein [Candidatus Velthaea sp.]
MLSTAEARRIALRAQGFGAARPGTAAPGRAIMGVFERIGLVQIDSVNVIVRSHYLPLFSRLGAYDVKLLERLVWEKRGRKLFEYWGHEASLIPLALHPLFRWRMARAARGEGTWGRVAAIARDKPEFVKAILREVEQRGPLASGDIAEHRTGGGGWWGWSEVKVALEYLFWSGAVTTARRHNFERLYDLPERVFAPAVLAAPTPDEATAKRELLRIAARALGIATRSDLRDYFRLEIDANARIDELVEHGDLLPVSVEGWKQPAYLACDTIVPRRIDARALLSPFDSLVWERSRDRRVFDFDYRIEIYTPAAKRVHGYYVLPFLYGDRLAARVDAKARRDTSMLKVIAIHYEDAKPAPELREDLRAELTALARWLGLERVKIGRTLAQASA